MTFESARSAKRALARRPLLHGARPKTSLQVVSIALAFGLVCFRAIEAQPSWLEFLRFAASLSAIAFVSFAPHQSFFKRAIAIVAVDAFAGVVLFGFIDAPAVLSNRAQIATFAVSVQGSIERLERRASLRR